MTDTDTLKDAREAYREAADHWAANHATGLEDLRFARLGEQWPPEIIAQRAADNRPCLTINKLPAFIRQVVNDARLNKPSIKVRPADGGADRQTAEIIGGIIRNIEHVSSADVAYDTAAESAVTCGFGYFRIGLDYAFDDAFAQDLSIQRISNPFSVLPDPLSTAADSADWNTAFVVDRMAKDAFRRTYKGAAAVDFDADYAGIGDPWLNGEEVLVAEWWTREEVERKLLLLSSGAVVAEADLAQQPTLQAMLATGALTVARERLAKTHRVRQRILTGADIIDARDWPGRYIPIVPVYGDEIDVEGRRHFRSLVHGAKDAQRMYNYWRSTSTELVALAPKVPFIGPEGAFSLEPEKWATANTVSHAYLEYKGGVPPQRQPLDAGPAGGALQEALNANDDMKAVIGLHDASLGARSNETSGLAILYRQREGDVSTFHFVDNLARAIRHAGRILIDLIPHVYSGERIVRVIGEDGKEAAQMLQRPVPVLGPDGQPMLQPGPAGGQQQVTRIYDLAAGKYDLTVSTGPSFTTRRDEAAMQMIEMVRALPAMATVIAPELARNLDWPGADRIAERLDALAPNVTPPPPIPPEVMQAIEAGQQRLAALEAENTQLRAGRDLELMKLDIERQRLGVDMYEAETARYGAAVAAPSPGPIPARGDASAGRVPQGAMVGRMPGIAGGVPGR